MAVKSFKEKIPKTWSQTGIARASLILGEDIAGTLILIIILRYMWALI